jgi:hypothetical protein
MISFFVYLVSYPNKIFGMGCYDFNMQLLRCLICFDNFNASNQILALLTNHLANISKKLAALTSLCIIMVLGCLSFIPVFFIFLQTRISNLIPHNNSAVKGKQKQQQASEIRMNSICLVQHVHVL